MEGEFKYLEYSSGEHPYYQQPKSTEKELFSVNGLSDNWKINDNDSFWTMYYLPDQEMIDQGWKIHVTTVFEKAEETLAIVSKILLKLNIPFKHVKDKGSLFGMYSKNGSRISAGKFMTIYPNLDEFIPLMKKLKSELKDLPKGPYILTDKSWKDSNVYYRYGGFREIKNENDEYCILNPEGQLVPDVRDARYYVPDFVDIPKELKLAEETPSSEVVEVDNKLRLYKVEKAIRFSNAGGIYHATRKSDGKKCIIKEARANIGLDGKNNTAVKRLQVEYDALKKLEDISGVVKALDYFVVWDHTFLILELVEGESLHSWVAKNYPFTSENQDNNYANKIQGMMDTLKNILVEVHQQDIAMCDLQTQNIMVDDKLNVRIIDFETAEPANVESDAVMGAKGFYHGLNRRTQDRDWYSLNRVYQFCLLPVGAVYDLDMSMNTKHSVWIYEHFGQIAYEHFYDFQLEGRKRILKFDDIFSDTYEQSKKLIDVKSINKVTNVQQTIEKLKDGLLANCNADTESLINGDIRQFEMDAGLLNLQNGGFGAILALLRANSLNDDILPWINKQLPNLFLNEYNEGFLTGRSGIACTLYECGYQQEAMQLMNLVIGGYKKNTNDISLRSGLSGIGMALVAMYQKSYRGRYLSEAREIAETVMKKIVDDEEIAGTDWESVNLGLLDGYSGASIFFSLLYKATGEEKYLQASNDAIQKDIDNSFTLEDGTLQIYDPSHNRVLPYLSNGSIGIGVAITTLNQVSAAEHFKVELSEISKILDLKVSIEPGMFDGLSGLLIANNFVTHDTIPETLDKLSLYLIEHEDKLLFPGRMLYKLSSDLHTGVAGVLLSVLSAQENNPLLWMPLVHELFENKTIAKAA